MLSSTARLSRQGCALQPPCSKRVRQPFDADCRGRIRPARRSEYRARSQVGSPPPVAAATRTAPRVGRPAWHKLSTASVATQTRNLEICMRPPLALACCRLGAAITPHVVQQATRLNGAPGRNPTDVHVMVRTAVAPTGSPGPAPTYRSRAWEVTGPGFRFQRPHRNPHRHHRSGKVFQQKKRCCCVKA